MNNTHPFNPFDESLGGLDVNPFDDIPFADYDEDFSAPASDDFPLGSQSFAPEQDAQEAQFAKERASLYAKLNERQHEAVMMPKDESVLILAGAGSGKTSVITARVAHLIEAGVSPHAILAVTFTNKAAEEMKVRLKKLMNKHTVSDLMVGTFHSLCSRILRDNFSAAGLPKSFAILDVDGQESMCRGILKDLGLTRSAAKASAGDDGESASHEFVTPAHCAKYISSRKEAGASPNPSGLEITTQSQEIDQLETVFQMYQDRCAASGLLDFQDLLTKTVSLLERDHLVRNIYRDRFKNILVDEFQDTNNIQYRWLELLKGEQTHVMAVGDDYQSIYAFRGANPKNMFRFLREMTASKDAPQGRIVKLEQNYRSLPHILAAANAVIARNTGQMEKTLFTTQPEKGERIDVVTYSNGMFEAKSIASSIHHFIRQKDTLPSEIAVLYRTNQQSRLIEQELNKLGVPLTLYGGYRFFERQEVKIVLAYMDLVSDMTHDLSFAKVANFPPRGLGERTIEELRQMAKDSGTSMMETILKRSEMMAANPASIGTAAAQKKHKKLEEFAFDIMEMAELAMSQPLHVVIEAIVDRFKIKEHYLSEATPSEASQEEAKERVGNIEELVSAATQFELENENLKDAVEQLPEYMAYVALMTSTSESDMSRKNTVSLMTVHSSKGLEFDHVFIAGLDETVFPHNRAIQEDLDREAMQMPAPGASLEASGFPPDGDGMQEERRLMYVAITRARKTLTVTHSRERMINGQIKKYEPSRFLLEMPEDRLRRIDDSKEHGQQKEPIGRVNAPSFQNRQQFPHAAPSNAGKWRPVIAPSAAPTPTTLASAAIPTKAPSAFGSLVRGPRRTYVPAAAIRAQHDDSPPEYARERQR